MFFPHWLYKLCVGVVIGSCMLCDLMSTSQQLLITSNTFYFILFFSPVALHQKLMHQFSTQEYYLKKKVSMFQKYKNHVDKT